MGTASQLYGAVMGEDYGENVSQFFLLVLMWACSQSPNVKKSFNHLGWESGGG